MIVFISLCLACFGAFMIFKPRVMWAINEKWKGNADEPSDFYMVMTRGAGCVLLVMALICMMM